MNKTLILGIETSCDETAAAVVSGGSRLHSNIIASQAELHRKYGGVVPEIASRRHLETVNFVIEQVAPQAAHFPIWQPSLLLRPGTGGAPLVGLITKHGIYAENRCLR